MVYKSISSRQVVAKVLSDLNIKEEDIRISSIMEWIGEAIEKIGAVTQLERHISGTNGDLILSLSSNQTSLPSDLFRLNNIYYSTTETGSYFPIKHIHGAINLLDISGSTITDISVVFPESELVSLCMSLYSLEYAPALELINTDANVREMLNGLLRSMNGNSNYDNTYAITYTTKPGYIVTNVNKGFLKLDYDAIPLDDDGYPLIPDLISYIEAAYWYVTMKLKYPEYISGRMNREIYYDMRRSWNFYCKQAYGDAMMPNESMMETIKDEWVRLVPDMRSSDSMYSNEVLPQFIKNHTR